jgi:hypothetical protein
VIETGGAPFGGRGVGSASSQSATGVRARAREEALRAAEQSERFSLSEAGRRQLYEEAGDAAWREFEQAWKRGRDKRLAGTSP